jgi:Fic family protein
MSKTKSDKKGDIMAVHDRGESLGLMMPMVIGESSHHRGPLMDLVVELATKSAGLRHSLPTGVLKALADLVRSMNCYYSNLIEGHDTHPIDIERALKNDYSSDARKRDLQLEAKAHIAVQTWIDEGGLKGRETTLDGLCEIHRRFCELLPETLLWVEEQETHKRERIYPGVLRDSDVKVGNHIAISAGAVPRFLMQFQDFYSAKLGRAEYTLATAAAHHRLLWIHPFLDGNGRVARLMSHAMLLEHLDTGGLWSIARGLARHASKYKTHLANCDQPRRNDLDGRGNLSEEALAEFSHFFLTTCIDQVTYMQRLMQPEQLRSRILLWAEEETRIGALPLKSALILEAVLYRGELPRKDVSKLIGVSDRHARRVVSSLLQKEVVTSESQRSNLRLAFPATLAPRFAPGLFPEKK